MSVEVTVDQFVKGSLISIELSEKWVKDKVDITASIVAVELLRNFMIDRWPEESAAVHKEVNRLKKERPNDDV